VSASGFSGEFAPGTGAVSSPGDLCQTTVEEFPALRSLARDRKFEFDLERAAFALALQRLCAPGSDLAGSEWLKTVEASGCDDLALQHLYRTTAFLARVRQDLETRLFDRDLNLFTQTLEVVFIDTTSLYCYRDTETEWRKRGYSRDHRPDLPQWVLCVAVNA